MDRLDELRAERDELERRIAELERALGVPHLHLVAQDGVKMEAADLAASVEALFARLGSINAKLAELRDPGAPM